MTSVNTDGFLLIDKPVGWTSFDVVAKVRGVFYREYFESVGEKKKIKVGHTGTLDPLAQGLMLVVVGSYCKKADEFSKLDKVYSAEMKLGATSTTGDEEGEKLEISKKQPTSDEIEVVLKQFIGEIMQKPPIFSAIKVNGRRAYELAREGKEVKIEPRRVKIYSLDLIKYEYPYVKFVCKVSSGTYIRSLVEDIGEVLGTGAYMSGLIRQEVGGYSIKDAIEIDKVSLKNLIIDK